VRVRRGLLGLLVGAFALCAAAAAGAATASTSRLGPAPSAAPLQLVVPLQADDAGLQRFVQAISTPGSPDYGAYEPVSTLAARFGARPAVQRRALRFLRAAGATAPMINATGMFAEATMTVAQAERAFGTQLARFRGPAGRKFIAPVLRGAASAASAAAVRVPAGLRGAALGVVGLDTRPLVSGRSATRAGSRFPRHTTARAAAGEPVSGYLPVTGTQAGCTAGKRSGGFTPNQYLQAYNYSALRGAGLAGQGERVALIEIDGFKYSDVRTFARCFGLSIPKLSLFYVGSSHALPPGQEATLDLEVLDAAAPRLDAIEVYENAGDAAAVTRSLVLPLIAPGAKPQVVSVSLGICEPVMFAAFGRSGLISIERDIELAAATGITLVASSGDQGSASCVNNQGQVLDRLAVSYPASSPFITAVGGTNLLLTAGNTIKDQIVWNDTNIQLAAGGGGLSELYARPSYQGQVVSSNRRALPDVSMLADVAPGYAVYCTAAPDPTCAQNTPWHTIGGTSAAAPLLAGGAALVNQDLHRHKREFLGFMNPLLYQVGGSSLASSVFSDVTRFSNDVGPYIPGGNGQPLGCCNAVVGYDAASGWGSMNLASLDQVALQTLPRYGDVSISIPRPQKPLRSRGLRVVLHCSDACAAYSFAVITIGTRSNLTLRTRTLTFPTRGTKTVTLKFSRRQLNKLRTALAQRRRIEAEVFGVALDARGQVAKVTAGRAIVIRG
jgi:kumamolisin